MERALVYTAIIEPEGTRILPGVGYVRNDMTEGAYITFQTLSTAEDSLVRRIKELETALAEATE